MEARRRKIREQLSRGKMVKAERKNTECNDYKEDKELGNREWWDKKFTRMKRKVRKSYKKWKKGSIRKR